MKLALAEEQKIAASGGYRTAARTLRKLAAGHMLFEIPQNDRHANVSDWNRFEVRNVGLAVQRRMAREFAGDARRIRSASANFIKRVLALDPRSLNESKLHAFEDLALVLAMIPGIAKWSADEKRLAARLILAKAGGNESLYLRLMQKHAAMRAAVIGFGS